jgi:hypothetical protein
VTFAQEPQQQKRRPLAVIRILPLLAHHQGRRPAHVAQSGFLVSCRPPPIRTAFVLIPSRQRRGCCSLQRRSARRHTVHVRFPSSVTAYQLQ